MAFSPGKSSAQNYEWTHLGTDTNWATAANWTPAGGPIPDNADFLLSNHAGALTTVQTINLAVGRIVNSLTFDSSQAYTIGGTQILTFGNTGVAGLPFINLLTGTGPQANFEINTPVVFTELTTITNNSTDNLTFNGTIANDGGLVITGSGGTSFHNDYYEGPGGLSKYGTGTLFLRNSTTISDFQPDFTIHEGIVSAETELAVFYSQSPTASNTPAIQIMSGASLMVDHTPLVTTPQGTLTGTYGGVNVSGGGAHYNTQGDVGAIHAAPLINGTATVGGSNGASDMRLQGDTSFGAFKGTVLVLKEAVGETGTRGYDVTKVGEGVVLLSAGTAGWTGNTIVTEGFLSASDLPATNLILDGGVYGTYNTTAVFTNAVGTGANQVSWAGDGGFAKYGGSNNYIVNLGGAGATLTWGSGGFIPTGSALILGHEQSTGIDVVFQNGINLGNQVREIRTVESNYAETSSDVVTPRGGDLTGVLSGSGGLHKTGDGMLALTAANTYSGETRISEGALTLKSYLSNYVPGTIANSHIVLDGGVFMPPGASGNQSTATYTPTLGTAAGQVSWGGNGGGFASYANQATTVTLNNNATTPLVWGSTANFLGNTDTLILGSRFSNNTLTLNNAIDLNDGTRGIRVDDGVGNNGGVNPDVVLPQIISGGGTLNITGDGQLNTTATNTTTAAVNIAGATLEITGANGTLNDVSSITVSQGGTLSIGDDSTEIATRVSNSAPLNLNGGNLLLKSIDSSPVLTEDIGPLNLTGGSNTVIMDGSYTRLVADSLNQSNHGTVDFLPASLGNNATSASEVVFTSAPALTNGVLPWATLNHTDFATYGANGIDAVAGTVTAAPTASTGASNFKGAAADIIANAAINSLALTSGSLDGAFTLTVTSGGILSTADAAISINASTLKSGTTSLYIHTNDTVGTDEGLTITSSIQDGTAGATTLVKSGNTSLTLGGTTANTFSGGAVVNEGTVILNKTGTGANSVALSGNVTVGDRGGDDVLQVNASNQFGTTGAGTSLTLAGGMPTNPGGGTATLRFNGKDVEGSNLPAIDNTLTTLTVSMSGVIDFDGGLNDAPNYLRVSDLNFSDTASRLTITNWREFKDYLLIPNNETTDFAAYANQIHFDGYEGTSVITKYDNNYWAITPLGAIVPEPATSASLLLAAAALLNRRRPGTAR